MNLIEQLNYFHELWARLFPNRPISDDQISVWLDAFGTMELEKVLSKSCRRFRTERIETVDLYKYISGTLTHRRDDAEKDAEKNAWAAPGTESTR